MMGIHYTLKMFIMLAVVLPFFIKAVTILSFVILKVVRLFNVRGCIKLMSIATKNILKRINLVIVYHQNQIYLF